MARLFVSHASANDTEVTALSDWLTQAGFKDHFVDHQHLLGGDDWNSKLPIEARKAEIFLLYVTRDWLASAECFAEWRSAYYGGRPVVPLLVVNTLNELPPTEAERFDALCASVQGVPLDDLPPQGLTETLLKGSIGTAAAALRARRRARMLRSVGAVGFFLVAMLLALGFYFRDYLGAYADQRRIAGAFAPLSQDRVATLAKATDLPVFRDCTDAAICPEMKVLPPGRFWMGSTEVDDFLGEAHEWPPHEIAISSGLAVSVTEITQAQWTTCFVATRLGEGPKCKEIPKWEGREDFPVESISHLDARAYVAWLNLQVVGTMDGPYRLLSEAEWEYAARGITDAATPHTRYSWGPDLTPQVCDHANALNATMPDALGLEATGVDCPNNPVMMSRTAEFTANPFGLFDTAGNVAEWVADCWWDSHHQRPGDARAREIPGNATCDRVIKGGSWSGVRDNLRPAARVRLQEDLFGFNIGLRVARDLTWQPQ